ncbi:MAG TPA: methylated-DNA--[protein]-cysteine S-methyltransferase [Microbacteriaceae bacterium]|nr:methylated-DNA--[protein]-cysteine S-methyltransferase [Microbacteriaceae bacterium]
MSVHTVVESALGGITLVGGDEGLEGLYMAEHRHPRRDGFGQAATGRERHALFDAATAQLGEYFAGERTRFDLVLAPHGTPFQLTVWNLLRRIEYGQTWSYRRLAEEYGNPKAVRAVAAANARNPLSIVVPCHRVIGSDGSLVGYGGGLWRKEFLLELEGGRGTGQGTLF